MTVYPITDLGDFGADCYIIPTPENNAVLIDAPYSAEVISKKLGSLGLNLKKILLTHGHCDHIEALGGLREKYGCEVYISAEDSAMLTDPRLCLASYFGTDFTPFYGAKPLGSEVVLDGVTLKVIPTPGHSAGSVCYLADDCIFTGDTLFAGSVGRTDLGGSFSELMNSVAKLIRLGKNYVIYPGHGGASDLDAELMYNPYLEELRRRL